MQKYILREVISCDFHFSVTKSIRNFFISNQIFRPKDFLNLFCPHVDLIEANLRMKDGSIDTIHQISIQTPLQSFRLAFSTPIKRS